MTSSNTNQSAGGSPALLFRWLARPGFGGWCSLVGVAAICFALWMNVSSIGDDSGPTCDLSEAISEPASEALHSRETSIRLNESFCVAINPGVLFAAERDARIAKAAEVATQAAIVEDEKDKVTKAETDRESKLPGADAAEIAKLDQAVSKARDGLGKAQNKLADLNEKLLELGKPKEVSFFIGDDPVPFDANNKLRVPIDKEGWVWKEITLRAPADNDTDGRKAWRDILAGASEWGVRPVSVGLGAADAKIPNPNAVVTKIKVQDPDDPAKTMDQDLVLTLVKPYWVPWLGGGGLFLMAFGIVFAGWNSGLLRDLAPGGDDPPFSLARVQMAWWLLLTLGGFLFVWLITFQYNDLMTGGVLTLIGLSGFSGVTARVIDNASASAAAEAAEKAGTALPQRLVSQGFFFDILSDGNSIGLQRVQMVVWTVVLGAIFIYSAVRNLAFPEFDQGLLILAGVINATYLGFKFPESTKPK